MRITGGVARGIQLRVPKGSHTRPAMDSLRESVFSSLGQLVSGASFLDLFAGTGAYGLEALSRGAQNGLFIEKNREALLCLQKNVESVCKSLSQNTSVCEIANEDVFRAARLIHSSFDLVFVDPPYETLRHSSDMLMDLATKGLKKNPNTRLILEFPADLTPPLLHDMKLIRRLGKNSSKNSPSVSIYSFSNV